MFATWELLYCIHSLVYRTRASKRDLLLLLGFFPFFSHVCICFPQVVPWSRRIQPGKEDIAYCTRQSQSTVEKSSIVWSSSASFFRISLLHKQHSRKHTDTVELNQCENGRMIT